MQWICKWLIVNASIGVWQLKEGTGIKLLPVAGLENGNLAQNVLKSLYIRILLHIFHFLSSAMPTQ